MKLNIYHKGVSLLEVMLVLVIGSSIMMMGFRQYESLRRDSNVQQVVYNVDQIFQAAAYYYQANCRVQIDPVNGQINGTGTLDPRYIDSTGTAVTPPNPYPVLLTDLAAAGFMTVTLPNSPIVATTGTNGGYFVQFNQTSPAPDRTIQTTTSSTVKLGQIVMWRIQVSVQLQNVKTATSYMHLLNADCLSTLDPSGTTVTPCSQVTTPPTTAPIYAVWERLPSMAVPTSNSNMWTTNAANKEFTELYQSYSIMNLSNAPASSYPQQYYLCGS